MPNFLKQLFKPTVPGQAQSAPSHAFRRQQRAEEAEGERNNDDALHRLADAMRDLGLGADTDTDTDTGGGSRRGVLRKRSSRRLVKAGSGDGKWSALAPISTSDIEGYGKGKGTGKGKGRARGTVVLSEEESSDSGQAWGKAVNACTEALNLAETLLAEGGGGRGASLMVRIVNLLEAQRDELLDLRNYAEGRELPTLQTLAEIYLRVSSTLSEIPFAPNSASLSALSTLLQVLAEGPDYLLDVTIIEAVIWQAEVIDAGLGGEVREVLDKAVAEQNNLVTFRRAAESIIAIASALPREELDDEVAREAYRAIGVLVKQLQARVASSRWSTPASSMRQASTETEPSPSPVTASPIYASSDTSSPIPSPLFSPAEPPLSPLYSSSGDGSASGSNGGYEALDAPSLESRFGTGVKAAPSPYYSTPSPATPTAGTAAASASASATTTPPSPSHSASGSSASEASVWEYKGHLMTRSALELVLAQEALAGADSSGQYARDVEWDELRNAWIPAWADKLRPEDLADGEVPTTNPADFKVKEKDAWGNKIAWKNGRMYYVDDEDPTFELP